jgi:hypothetical protein
MQHDWRRDDQKWRAWWLTHFSALAVFICIRSLVLKRWAFVMACVLNLCKRSWIASLTRCSGWNFQEISLNLKACKYNVREMSKTLCRCRHKNWRMSRLSCCQGHVSNWCAEISAPMEVQHDKMNIYADVGTILHY